MRLWRRHRPDFALRPLTTFTSRLLVQHFDRQRDTLAAADAEGDQTAGEAVAAHRLQA